MTNSFSRYINLKILIAFCVTPRLFLQEKEKEREGERDKNKKNNKIKNHSNLECSRCCVTCIWMDFNRFLKHHPEGIV
jgi:hypothetical protein